MDTRAQKPTLSVGNQIYLYRLLSESIGCGRQTIMGKVEEALAADRMGAEDLGFESTRALLEALDAFVTLTVFKGGRIYATVTAQPAWDEALAAPEKQAAPAGKSWKRKKADKSLKPVRPRRVKRAVEAAPDAEAEAPDRYGAAGAADTGVAVKDAPGGAAGGSPAPTEAAPAGAAPGAEGPSQPRAAEAAASPSEPAGEREPAHDEATGGAEPAAQQADSPKVASPEAASPEAASPEAASPARDEDTAQADGAGSAADGKALSPEDAASPAEPAREPAAQPAISLTVVYDPENANAGVTTLESTPDAGGRAAASEAALPDTDTTEAASPEAASPEADATDVASPEAETPEADSPARTEASPSPAGADGAKPRAPRPPRAPRNRTDRAGARTGRSAADDAGSRIRGDRGAGTVPAPSEPRPLPEGYPADLTRDVYCPGPVLHELALLLPLGADALGILDAYYRIAQLLGTLEAGRNRASFPLGYLRDGERLTATVRLRRKRGDAGAAWVVDAVEAPTGSAADGR